MNAVDERRAGAPALTRAAGPLSIALAGVIVSWATGLTQRSFFGTPVEDVFYGFFLDRYPLFLFAVVYGVAWILIGAILDPGARRGLRLLSAPPALVLFLAVCLYPTFGGLALRAGFMTGGMAFVANQPMSAASILGAGSAALVYGLALGFAGAVARMRVSLSWRALGRSVLGLLTVWFGALVLGSPRAFGFDPTGGWPSLPLSGKAAMATAALVAAALLPHALLTARSASFRT